MTSYSNFALLGKRDDARAAQTLAQIAAYLRARIDRAGSGSVCIAAESGLEADIPGVVRVPEAQLGSRCDLAIVVGGDGTLLAAGRTLAPHGVPMLGINQGRLGFMVDVPPDSALETIDAVLSGDAVVESRLMLQARILHQDGRITGPLSAVNDVVLRSLASIRMIEFETWSESEFISRHRADGMIVATPTGSTAYALSGGGPVLHPDLDAVALVPICPHTLSDRPIVIGANRTIRIVLRGDGSRAMATCDGQLEETILSNDIVEVSRAPFPLRLVHPCRYNYFDVLREKLHWGRGLTGDNEPV